MKTSLLILTLISNLSFAENVSLTPVYQGESNSNSSNANIGNGAFGGLGVGGYPGYSNGNSNGNSNSNAGSISFQDSNKASKYTVVRPTADCPLLTQSAKDDQDVFSDLQSYFNSFSQKAECSQDSISTFSGRMALTQLETMLNTTNDQGNKCYSKNVSQVTSRNMALYYIDKGLDISMTSPYYNCSLTMLSATSGTAATKDDAITCISKKFQESVELNTQICKGVVAPAQTQENINKGMVELERILINSLSQKSACAPSSQDAFKATMNTFLKVKSLSVIGPWGAMAGFGADLIGSLLDKFFPSDSQRASALLTDILNENNFEQNACLYYNIEQKMYCSDISFQVQVPNTGCNKIEVNKDLVSLMNQVKELKNVSESVQVVGNNNLYANMNGFGAANNGNSVNPTSTAIDVTKLENKIDDIIKYAKASEEEIRSRVKSLPKVQQARELSKINRMYDLLNRYQNFDVNDPALANEGQKVLEDLSPLLLGDNNQRINFDDLVLKSTPGLKFDALKQAGISSTVETLLANSENAYKDKAEKSRSMAKYNKYKNAMGEMAQGQFKSRLEKQFDEFKKQTLFVAQKDNGVINDQVSEGILRNIVRHCTLMQEIYDPKVEGTMPRECQKFSCGNENRLNWFQPKKGQSNLTEFKKNFCEKNFSYVKIEEDFIKELRDPSGAKLCGKKINDFF